ncbi:MAG: iron-sulfur cluster assembly scaffold protein [Caldisericum sp.]
MYPKIVIEHFMKPRNVGTIKNATAIGYSETQGGGKAVIYLLIENGLIKDFKYQVDGCPFAIASASILSENFKGNKIEEINRLNTNYFLMFFDIPEDKVKCIELVVDAFNDALSKVKDK